MLLTNDVDYKYLFRSRSCVSATSDADGDDAPLQLLQQLDDVRHVPLLQPSFVVVVVAVCDVDAYVVVVAHALLDAFVPLTAYDVSMKSSFVKVFPYCCYCCC